VTCRAAAGPVAASRTGRLASRSVSRALVQWVVRFWNVELALLGFLETAWSEPDKGIWEIRGPAQQFTHSKVMAWVAIDRAVKTVWVFLFPLLYLIR
jgi:GH15 family glucan-1,4-alpha-glucosidase